MYVIKDNQEKRGRGPGKKPAKVYLSLRVNPEQYEWLQSQGKNKSQIVRKLIQAQIEAQLKPEQQSLQQQLYNAINSPK
jgi:hypothetical protein